MNAFEFVPEKLGKAPFKPISFAGAPCVPLRSISAMKLSFLVLFSILILLGCTSTYKSSRFLSDYTQLEPGRIFKQEFIAPGADFSKFERVQLQPLSVKYLENKHEYREEEIHELDRAYLQAFTKLYQGKYIFVSPRGRADKKTLIIKTALTHLDSPKRHINVLAPITRGSAAFEVKLIDGGTKKILAEVAEKHTGSSHGKPLISGSYTRLTDAKFAIKSWAKKLSLLIQSYGA